MTHQEPKYIKGDGLNTPDLKLFVGAYLTISYWQADPKNKQQPTIHIKNDSQPGDSALSFHPNHAAQLSAVLSFINKQIN